MSEQEANLSQSNFFGHPIGLRTLFFTELWERMSYYGMRGLLVLYMTIGVVGNPGLGWSNVEANAIYGIYAGMVYFLALPGGWLADNLLGYQKAVLYGALIIMLGHFTLAIPLEETFILSSGFCCYWNRSSKTQYLLHRRTALCGSRRKQRFWVHHFLHVDQYR